MQTPLQELQEKVTNIIEDNSKQNSQFHKGFRHGMTMVKEAIEQILLEKEKQFVVNAINDANDAFTKVYRNEAIGVKDDNVEILDGEKYYNEKYNTDVVIKKESFPLMDIPCLTIKEVAPIFGRFYLDNSKDTLDRLTLKLEKLVESKLPPTT